MEAGKGERKGRVLVVEDSSLVATMMRDFLTEAGYDVTTAPSKSAALKKAATTPFFAVIVDLTLPDGSGPDLVHAMKQGLPESRVIVLSGDRSLASKSAALAAGADGFVTKPFERAEEILRFLEGSPVSYGSPEER